MCLRPQLSTGTDARPHIRAERAWVPYEIDPIEAKKRNAQNRHYDVSIACRLTGFLPRKVLLKGSGMKLLFPYDQVEISVGDTGRGLVASGKTGLHIANRRASIKIVGGTAVVNRASDHRTIVPVRCTAVTDDMTYPPTSVTWLAAGKPVPNGQLGSGGLVADILVDISGADVGAKVKKQVSVTIVDGDKLPASAQMAAVVTIIYYKLPPHTPKRPLSQRQVD